MHTHHSADDLDVHRFVDTTSLTARVSACSRTERLEVIRLLNEAVENEVTDQLTADDILLEWDVANFPEQLPQPVVAYVQRKPYRLLRQRPEPVLAPVIEVPESLLDVPE